MRTLLRQLGLAAAVGALLMPIRAAQAQLLITGDDEKVSFDENTGRIEGKTVRKVAQADVGGLAEGSSAPTAATFMWEILSKATSMSCASMPIT